MKLRFILSSLMILALSFVMRGSTPAPSAAEILRKAQAEITDAPSIEASFTVTSGHNSSKGSIIVSGNRFRLITPEMSTWFDGKTQWSYSPAVNEVNISEPTPEELRQINPFAIIEGLRTNFTARRISSPAGTDRLQLTPKGKSSEYTMVTAVFNASTHLPSEISLTGADRAVTKIVITSIKKGKALKPDTFRFNKAQYPGAEIVDLR